MTSKVQKLNVFKYILNYKKTGLAVLIIRINSNKSLYKMLPIRNNFYKNYQ